MLTQIKIFSSEKDIDSLEESINKWLTEKGNTIYNITCGYIQMHECAMKTIYTMPIFYVKKPSQAILGGQPANFGGPTV